MELYKWTIASIAIGYLMTHRQRLPLEPQSVELEPTLPVAQKWGTWATTMSQDMAISGKCWLKNQHFGGSLVSDKFQTNPDIWEKRGKRPQLVDVVCWWWGPGVSDWNRGHYSSWRAAVDSVLQSSVSETTQMRRCVNTSPAKTTDSWPFSWPLRSPVAPELPVPDAKNPQGGSPATMIFGNGSKFWTRGPYRSWSFSVPTIYFVPDFDPSQFGRFLEWSIGPRCKECHGVDCRKAIPMAKGKHSLTVWGVFRTLDSGLSCKYAIVP